METILSYLKQRYGYDHFDRSFYRSVALWERWYNGEGTEFHRTKVNNGLTVTERSLSKMNMAKKVAEDWANLLMNEKTEINVETPAEEIFLAGTDGRSGVLGNNGFRTGINRLIEQTFALGTGAVVLRMEGARVSKDGTLLPSPGGHIAMDFVSAPNIFPLSWQGERITEAAFAGSMTLRGESILYLQVHRKEEDGYVIDSICFSERTGGKVPLPEGICPKIRTGSFVPWFIIFKPNIINNRTDLPMGISVYANAIDILKGLDLCYDSFDMEFFLGKKMVFLRKDLMMQDDRGQFFTPQDCNRQLFMYIGDKNIDGDLLPQEFNPALRVKDHADAIQQHLNYLSCLCGFGDRHYSFHPDTTPTTATEIISGNATLYRSVKKHEILLEKSLMTLCKAILHLGARFLNKELKEESKISVRFDDSIIEDRTAEQKRDMELVAMGLMLKWEFRRKHYGESEEQAKERCKEGETT